MRITARLSWMAVAASFKSLFISTISADSMAMSVPAPMAMPTSARARAGASLMPSPTIATFLPSACKARTCASLSCGNTSAMTVSRPSCLWMALAVCSLSPVIITTSRPICLKVSIAWALVGLMVSATAIKPSTLVWSAKYSGVLPSFASCCALSSKSCRSTPCSRISCTLPA